MQGFCPFFLHACPSFPSSVLNRTFQFFVGWVELQGSRQSTSIFYVLTFYSYSIHYHLVLRKDCLPFTVANPWHNFSNGIYFSGWLNRRNFLTIPPLVSWDPILFCFLLEKRKSPAACGLSHPIKKVKLVFFFSLIFRFSLKGQRSRYLFLFLLLPGLFGPFSVLWWIGGRADGRADARTECNFIY